MPRKNNFLRLNNSLLFGGSFARLKNTNIRRFFMKNKILFLGSLCLILAFGLVVIGCAETVDNKLPEVALKIERVVGDVAAKDSQSPLFIVSWKAVEGAVKYKVFTQTQLSDASVFDVAELATGSGAGVDLTNAVKYDAKESPSTIGAAAAEATMSDWAVIVDFATVNTAIDTLGLGRVGVMAIPLLTDKEPSLVWTEYVDFDKKWPSSSY
jgi:hypothetical protein